MSQIFYSKNKQFKQILLNIKIDNITNDLLVKNYLQKVIEQQEYYINTYCWVLEYVLQKSTNQINQISLLDFGCGNGMFTLFAKYCGFGKVYGCDFNENFVAAARLLSIELNIEVDDWFVCNEDELYNTCNTLKLDVIVGTDVIEHIYNLNVFYKNISLLNPIMITAFTTASVNENYFKRKSLYKLMQQDEYVGSNLLEATSKDEFAGMAYLEIRKKIITKCFPNLTMEQVCQLSVATRGLRKDDIELFVKNYFRNGNISSIHSNKHNTCDPITGNFTERMLSINEYRKLYTKNSFNLTVVSGFYATEGKAMKSLFQKLLNKMIVLLNNSFLSRTISPLILLIGYPKNK